MRKAEREFTDIDMIDTLLEIIDLIVDTYDNPIRKGFEKSSRCAQHGYDTLRLLMDKGYIKPGKVEGQQRLENT